MIVSQWMDRKKTFKYLLYFVKLLLVSFICKATDRNRTYDTQMEMFLQTLLLAWLSQRILKSLLLYQLSYRRIKKEPGAGLEPATSALSEQNNIAGYLFQQDTIITRSTN